MSNVVLFYIRRVFNICQCLYYIIHMEYLIYRDIVRRSQADDQKILSLWSFLNLDGVLPVMALNCLKKLDTFINPLSKHI